jgi:hypothetical protein
MADFAIPTVFLRKIFSIMDGIRAGDIWEEQAFKRFCPLLAEMAG